MLCVTVTPKSRTLAKVDILNAQARGDIVEVALDNLVKDPDFTDLMEGASKPILFSCRRREEGGSFKGSEEERIQLLKRAIVAKPDYIELDQSAAAQIKRFGQTKRVISFCSLSRPESRPGELIDEAKLVDGDIVKFVWPTPTLEDAWPLLQLTVSKTKLPVVGLGIGRPGLTFSLLAHRHGAPWVYAALEPGMETYDGQATVDDLVETHLIRGIDEKTAFIAVTGVTDGAIRAARAMNHTFEASGVNARCLPLEARDPSQLTQRLEKLKIKTILPVGGDAAALSGAVAEGETDSPDVMLHKKGTWKGYATLDRAALRELKKTYEPDWPRANVLVLGLTRLAQAIARDLAGEGAMVSLCGTDERATEALAQQLGCRSIPLRQLYNTLADVIVIADPDLVAGTGRTEINPGYFRPNMTVLDVSSLPDLHPLGEEATGRGAKVVPPGAIYAKHLDAVLKTLTGGGLDEEAKDELAAST